MPKSGMSIRIPKNWNKYPALHIYTKFPWSRYKLFEVNTQWKFIALSLGNTVFEIIYADPWKELEF